MMTTYKELPDGLVIRYDDFGVVWHIPPDPDSPAYQDYQTWLQTHEVEQQNETILRQRCYAALQINRDQSAQNDSIIAQAQQIEEFTGTSLTQEQIIDTFKKIAQGVRVLAQHDQTNKEQLNGLIRLQINDLGGLD